MNTEQRLIELETKIAFLENTIEELNGVVTDQQRQIDVLEQELKTIGAKIRSIASVAGEQSKPTSVDSL